MFNRLDYHNNMLTCLIHLLQYCFQGQFVHICNEIALKASFTMLSLLYQDGISLSVPLFP